MWLWGGRVGVCIQVIGRCELHFALQQEREMYGPGGCIAKDVMSFPPPAWQIVFAGCNSIGLAFVRGIFEEEGLICMSRGRTLLPPTLLWF